MPKEYITGLLICVSTENHFTSRFEAMYLVGTIFQEFAGKFAELPRYTDFCLFNTSPHDKQRTSVVKTQTSKT